MNVSASEGMFQRMRENWWLYLLLGIVMVIIGMAAIGAPFITALTVTSFLGLVLVVGGILHAVHAFGQHGAGSVILGLVVALLYIVAGLMLLSYPLRGLAALTLFLAIFFFAEGIFKIVASSQLRAVPNWGWYLVSGIVSLILGIMIWSGWPSSAIWAIGLLLGIDLIVTGFAMIAFAVTSHAAFEVPSQPLVGQH